MVNHKMLVNMASKVAAMGRGMFMLARVNARPDKGHFAVYTTDGRRFVVPLAYLDNPIFLELLKMSEEEFGLSGNGPITVPCDGVFMDYVVSLVQRRVCGDVEKALVVSMASGRCSSAALIHQGESIKQFVLVHGF